MRVPQNLLEELIENEGELRSGPVNTTGILRLALDLKEAREASKLKQKRFDEMYALLEEWTNRSTWGNHGMVSTTGHLGLCSAQCGPAEECHICGTTIRSINLLNEIDLSK